MNRTVNKKSIFLIFFLLLCLIMTLFGCNNNAEGEQNGEKKVTVTKIEVDSGTSQLTGYAGDFDVSRIRLNVYLSDGNVDFVNVETSFIDTNSKPLLNKVGTPTIIINYKGCTTKVSLTLSEKPKNMYVLTATDAVPVKINGVVLAEPVIYDGTPFSASYVEGTTVTLEWVQKEGYHFVRWTDNGNEIGDKQSTIDVIMRENHSYIAHSDPYVNSVTFVTNCDDVIPTRQYEILYESNLDELEKDGYVFDGWTTAVVTGDDAINCTAEKIVFPYEVLLNTTLYGTWRELGLEYESYVTDSGDGGYRILDYVRNDKELIIPEKHNNQPIVAIAADAFLNATKLEKLYIPSTVQEIEPGFLRNCARLKSIEVSSGSSYFTTDGGVLLNLAGNDLYAYPAGLLNGVYEIEDGIITIRKFAFYNAVIGAITVPASVRTIGDYAFNSVHLDYVDLMNVNPNEVNFSLGTNLFNDNLSELLLSSSFISVYQTLPGTAGFSDRMSTEEPTATIGINASKTLIYKTIINENSDNNVTTTEVIGADRSMDSLDLPIALGVYNVSSIGYAAFNGCLYLQSITIPKESKLERILEEAFTGTPYEQAILEGNGSIVANNTLYKYLANEKTFSLPKGIQKIAEGAFRGKVSLERIVQNSNNELKVIGPFAFYGCTNLVGTFTNENDLGYKLKRTVTTIGNYAFAYSGIVNLDLSNGSNLTTIGKEAFRDCHYLTGVTIGSKTSDISEDAFLFCYSMQAFTVQGDNPDFVAYDGILYGKNADSVSYDLLFAYPSGKLLDEFNVNAPTENNQVQVVSIGEYALFYANILSLYVPSSVRNISSSAMYLPGLVSVRFESINQGITYSDLFVKRDENLAVAKKAPEFITVTDLSGENVEKSINTFFGNNVDLRTEIYRENARAVFLVDDDVIYRIYDDHATVAKFSRVDISATVPDTVSFESADYNVTALDQHAFCGFYLTELTLGRYLSLLPDFSLSEAYSLLHLFTDDSTIADVEEFTFGSLFNDGLFVYINMDRKAGYQQKWDADEKYLIDKLYGEPKVTFKHPDEESWDGADIEPMYGEITQDTVPLPTRTGYTFAGWSAPNQEEAIDFTNGYIPPYNITLTCSWTAREYTIEFRIGDLATMESTMTTVHFGENYSFEIPEYANHSKELSYWRTADGHRIEISAEWDYLGEGTTIVLTPVWEDVQYILLYDTEQGAVTVAEDRKIVYFGTNYQLLIPEKEGYVFLGWSLDPEGEIMLTDKEGVSLLPWQENEEIEYTITAQWNVKTGIVVSLYFNSEILYKEVEVTYGQEFCFPYNPSDIVIDMWRDKADIFCGWYSEYDLVAESGAGTRYTDEDGNGLFGWNVGHNTNLYAQWPMEVSSGAVLENLSDSEMSRSIVLTADVTVTRPIGRGNVPYTGTFNGKNHTITFTYDASVDLGFDGYVGLFAYNKGTIKNFVLNANISIADTSMLSNGATVYVGAIAGRNDGKIISVSQSAEPAANVTLAVNITGSLSKAHVGGLVGYNTGVLTGVGMNLAPLSVRVNDSQYVASLHQAICALGLVFGTADGGNASSGGKSFVYHKASSTDPFGNLNVCGASMQSAVVDVAMSFEVND